MSDKLSDERLVNLLEAMHRECIKCNWDSEVEKAYQQIVQIIKLHFSDEWQQVKKDLGKFMQEQKPEITEGWIDEKVKEFNSIVKKFIEDKVFIGVYNTGVFKDFIRKLYEEMPARKATVSEEFMELITDALQIDGEHHKQWFLEQIAEKLGLNIQELRDKYDFEEGIAP